MPWIAILFGLLLAGSWVYCILMIVAVTRYRGVRPSRLVRAEPVSILKPVFGLDEGLEENLRSYFQQDYEEFEILFAARHADDAAWPVVERLKAEFPDVRVRTLLTGNPPYPNAKVFSLDRMSKEASYDLLIMSDSDTRAESDLVRTIAAEFQDSRLGIATCPYRAVPGRSFWSILEAIGMNTEFWGGCLTARLVEGGVHFAVGPTLAARRCVLEEIGGFDRLKDYLAEDFVMGQFAAAAGYGVILSSAIVEHRIGSQAWRPNWIHRLRWNRSSRRSRPAGYFGQIFTNPLPLALVLVAVWQAAWPALAVTVALRAAAAYAVSVQVLRDRLCRRYWWLVPVQDLASFAFWIAGFWGNKIVWRGRHYRLERDGRFELVSQ